ncbi:MAG: hypothetical protein IIB59_01870 [Planctomycetes bacterium]|nr:hypothetical protein [Planctomycetota bacterium]
MYPLCGIGLRVCEDIECLGQHNHSRIARFGFSVVSPPDAVKRRGEIQHVVAHRKKMVVQSGCSVDTLRHKLMPPAGKPGSKIIYRENSVLETHKRHDKGGHCQMHAPAY